MKKKKISIVIELEKPMDESLDISKAVNKFLQDEFGITTTGVIIRDKEPFKPSFRTPKNNNQ